MTDLDPARRIQPLEANPAYWQYKGEPVLPLGGTVEDNLFQIPDLVSHLDLLRSVGGNYVRNTMSGRDEGNVWPYRTDGSLYDLDQWESEYWNRFARFLALTAAREIIVQIEVWATWDFYHANWERHPYNPKCNVTYTAEQSGLPEVFETPPFRPDEGKHPFFWSVPAENNLPVALEHQQRFVDKMLSYSLKCDHVLYCMDNETSVTPEWGTYWSEYIKAKAKEAGVGVETTEMWDKWDLAHAQHDALFDHPETYSFADVSQNNHQKGQTHWDNAQKQRARIRASGSVRPMTSVKIYGGEESPFGDARDGMERFWRNIFGGLASARFHRPNGGLGLGEKAQANIRSLRSLTNRMDVFTCEPHNDLLSDRESNEAYCLAHPGREYAVYFPDGGEVTLDASAHCGPLAVQWLRIMDSEWKEAEPLPEGDRVKLSCPSRDYWAALIQGTSET